MAFKMRGFNPGKGTGLGSAFTKASPMKIDPPAEKKEEGDIKLKRSERPTTKETRAAEYKPVEGSEEKEGAAAGIPDYEARYSKEEIEKGAHAATDFYGREEPGKKKKLTTESGKHKKAYSFKHGSDKFDVGKYDKEGKAKYKKKLAVEEVDKKRGKKKAKTNVFTGKKTIKIDPIDKKQIRVKGDEKRHKKETGEDVHLGEGTARKDLDWGFEGKVKQDKDITDRKRKAQFDPKTGKVKEKYKSKLGFYRKTGREVDAKAYQQAGKEKQEGPTKKEQKATTKAKDDAAKKKKKADKKNPALVWDGNNWVKNPNKT